MSVVSPAMIDVAPAWGNWNRLIPFSVHNIFLFMASWANLRTTKIDYFNKINFNNIAYFSKCFEEFSELQ